MENTTFNSHIEHKFANRKIAPKQTTNENSTATCVLTVCIKLFRMQTQKENYEKIVE